MKIFVETAGFSQDSDYNWVDENQRVVETPKIVEQYTSLLQKESPSLLIARENNQLLLLVTGIQSSRRDYQNRGIRIAVAWLGRDQDEPKFRALASKILRSFTQDDTVAQEIDASITAGGKNGFTVNFSSLLSLVETVNIKNTLGELKKEIVPKSEEKLKELAKELEERTLPPQELPVVVVTGIQAYADFYKARVWRGLANFVDSPNPQIGDSFRPDNKGWNRNDQRKPEQNGSLVGVLNSKIVVRILAILLCISLSVNIWLFSEYQKAKDLLNKHQTVETLNREIEELKIQKENLRLDVHKEEDKKNQLVDEKVKVVNELKQIETEIHNFIKEFGKV